MPIPLLIPLIAAGIGILGTGAGAAIANWTDKPDYNFDHPTEPIYVSDSSGNKPFGIDTNTLMVAAVGIAAVYFLTKK